MTTFLGMPQFSRDPFPVAARQALGDAQLRHNLAHATHTIREKRAQVVAEVADWELLRDRGAAIKDEVLADLEENLDLLQSRLEANGVTVHRAADAAEASRIVGDITLAHGVDEVVKIKSMATAEIGLNEALRERGIAAWETDLAELIVQLGEDLPSHILVPAIHRNRAEIREIFARQMASVGRAAPADLTDDPGVLASAARLHLREKFLRAKVAVSGGNFAVVDSGSLVIVESEGNGRMCLTLPEVLISVVGIEKMVPRWTDLDVFLRLLPRSSTGERMNPYTSTWSGVTPGDGPQVQHVILLDNGRRRAHADPVGRQALRCIRCSACLNVCPVYERVGGHAYGSVYPGPIGAIITPLLRGVGHDEQVDSLPYASTLCGACYEVCPVKIDIPEVLVSLRTQVVDAHRSDRLPKAEQVAFKAAGVAFGDSRKLALGEKVSGLAGRILGRLSRTTLPGGRPTAGRLPFVGAAWTDARDLPAPPRESFRAWWTRRPVATAAPDPADLSLMRESSTGARSTSDSSAGNVEAQATGRRDSAEHTRQVGLFVERAEDYRATVERCTRAEVVERVQAALAGAPRVVVPAGLDLKIKPRAEQTLIVDSTDLDAYALDECAAVVTRARVGIAETGTIVLDHTPDQGRRAISLVPDLHVCIVEEAQIVADVPDAIAALDPARPQTWISGPSATSDIELDRVEGVHGPRTLHVLLVG